MKTQVIYEAIGLTEAAFDRDNRVLRNVTLIKAGMSKNRRHYPESVLQAAAGLFEGVKAYNDHALFGHKPTDITGWYTNVRYENSALKADRHFARTQAGEDVFSLVEDIVSGRAPKSLSGLSIAVIGEGTEKKFPDGKALEVESITAAHSVDDVTEPAAGGAYLAAGDGDGLAGKVFAALNYEDWQASRPDYLERLKKEWKQTRQDEALKTALAESEQLRAALETSQATLATLTAERDAAAAGEAAARRELAVVEALAATPGIPAAWREDLRDTLGRADPAEWMDILNRTKQKAQAAQRPRVPVTGAEAVQRDPAPSAPPRAAVPQPGEDVMAWAARVRQQT